MRFAIRFLLPISTTAILLLSPATTGAQDASTATTATGGTILVEQQMVQGVLGKWTLLMPYHLQTTGKRESKTIDAWPGSYTVIVEPPNGANATIRVFKDNQQVDVEERSQITFDLAAGDTLRVSIHYAFKRTGDIAISTDPPGVAYTLRGPNNRIEEGVTPGSYSGMPEGQYAVTYETIEGCPPTPQKSLQLVENGRISFHVKLACETANAMRKEQQTASENFVTVQTDGQQVVLKDVPQESWFATYVFDAAKGGMVSGYKDENGAYTGEFGPDKLVTIAELAKMAHRVGGIIETDITRPSGNPGVDDQWFAQYMTSAEHRGWTIYADATVDPLRPATRGEVIVTLLQALDVPVQWPKGAAFTDVTWRTPYAGAIETAASDEIVAGRTDADGVSLGIFEPNAPVNRAEMAKILVKAADAYRR